MTLYLKGRPATEATDAQWAYVVRLMNEAFAHLYKGTPNIDVHHQPTHYTKAQASADIASLLAVTREFYTVCGLCGYERRRI